MTTRKITFGGGGAIVQAGNTLKGLLQTSNMPVARPADPPIQVARWARNGKHPNAVAESMKSAAGNAAALMKTKQVFRSPGFLPASISAMQVHGMIAGSGVCNRWRCAFHTGPFTQYVDAETIIGPDSTYSTATSFGQLDLTEVATAAVTTVTFPTTALPALTLQSLRDFKSSFQRIEVKPNTDYTAVFSDHGSLMVEAHICEVGSLSKYNGGYLPQNNAIGGGILAGYRQNTAQLVRDLWQKGGWSIFNWSIEDGTLPVTTTSTTWTNLLDAFVNNSVVTTLGSTTISPNSGGFTFDTTGRGRRSQLKSGIGIPIVLAVYGSSALTGDNLQLVNSSGAIMADTVEVMGATPGWVYTTGFIPAGVVDKYDIQIMADVGTSATFHAVSIYELG